MTENHKPGAQKYGIAPENLWLGEGKGGLTPLSPVHPVLPRHSLREWDYSETRKKLSSSPLLCEF